MCSAKRLPTIVRSSNQFCPAAGSMLEFQFDSVYDVKALGTERLRPSCAAAVIGPIDAYRVRLILRDHVQSLVVLFQPLGLIPSLRCADLTADGSRGRRACGLRLADIFSLSASSRQCGELCQSRATTGPILSPSAAASTSARSDCSCHAPVGRWQMQGRGCRKNDRDQRASV